MSAAQTKPGRRLAAGPQYQALDLLAQDRLAKARELGQDMVWQVLERAHRTGRTLPLAVRHWFGASASVPL